MFSCASFVQIFKGFHSAPSDFNLVGSSRHTRACLTGGSQLNFWNCLKKSLLNIVPHLKHVSGKLPSRVTLYLGQYGKMLGQDLILPYFFLVKHVKCECIKKSYPINVTEITPSLKRNWGMILGHD